MLNIKFEDEPNLRSFVEKKISSLSKFTTLSLSHQMEIIITELLDAISNLFMMNEKIYRSKDDILEFCDSIQELVEVMDINHNSNESIMDVNDDSNVVQALEKF